MINKQVLDLHDNLRKAESSIAVQLRTGVIGLAATLSKLRVPGYKSGLCLCGQASETVRHLIVHCERQSHRRDQLRIDGVLDLNNLLNTRDRLKKVTKWVIKSGRLQQFSLAGTLLYD